MYEIPGYVGKFGIIPSYSRTFCGTCNRVRVSHKGTMRTCLYGKSVLDLREMIRHSASETDIKKAILASILKRSKDGFEAEEQNKVKLSMTQIGG